jgi:hypothetical protein
MLSSSISAPIPLIGTSWTLTSEATHCLAIEKLSFYNFLIFNKFPEKFYEKTGEKLALVAVKFNNYVATIKQI